MSKEYLETLGKNIRYKKEYIGAGLYRFYIKRNDIELLEQALTRLEEIDNAKPSEALEDFVNMQTRIASNISTIEYVAIKQALLKAQEMEKENELLKEIIKSFFDKGCPLHQYTDREGVLQIEVDDECSNMRLGEYKGVDLDKKLKEVLG